MGLVVAKVRRVWAESSRYSGVLLEVTAEVAALYRRPGQYIVVHGEGEPTFLAIASAPGERAALELLLGPPAIAALEPREGAQWSIEPPAGPGFPIESAHGRDSFLLGVGTGVAPLRALIEAMRRERKLYREITLYAGASTPGDHVYRDSDAAWRADEIEVRRVVSQPFVQDVLRADQPSLANAEAFVCGHSAMVDGVREVLTELGLDERRVHQNY